MCKVGRRKRRSLWLISTLNWVTTPEFWEENKLWCVTPLILKQNFITYKAALYGMRPVVFLSYYSSLLQVAAAVPRSHIGMCRNGTKSKICAELWLVQEMFVGAHAPWTSPKVWMWFGKWKHLPQNPGSIQQTPRQMEFSPSLETPRLSKAWLPVLASNYRAPICFYGIWKQHKSRFQISIVGFFSVIQVRANGREATHEGKKLSSSCGPEVPVPASHKGCPQHVIGMGLQTSFLYSIHGALTGY